MIKVILFLFVLIASANAAFGQAKEITEDDFWRTFRPAYRKSLDTSYRKKSIEESYKDGKVSDKTETVSEFIPPKKYHYIVVETIGGKSRKSEIFSIDNVYYCRKDDGEWLRSSCGYGSGIGGIPNPVTSEFTVEKVKLDNTAAEIYRQYKTYIFPEGKTSYFSDKCWINDEGFLLRRDMEYGSVDPKFVRSKQSEVYEYNPKDLKIEAPVK